MRHRHSLILLFVSTLLCSLPMRTWANGTLFTQIKEANAHVSTITTAFTQSSKLALFNTPLRSNGRLTLQKPQQLRWEYTSPSPSGFILHPDGNLQWASANADGTVRTFKLSPVLYIMAEQMLLWINMDETTLAKDFTIETTNSTQPIITLQPKNKDMAKFIKNIVITIPASLISIESIAVTEHNNSVITLIFDSPSINPTLSPTIFTKP